MDAKEAFEIVLEMALRTSQRAQDGISAKEVEALVIAEDYMEYWRGKVEYAKHHNERPQGVKEYLERQEFFNDTKGN